MEVFKGTITRRLDSVIHDLEEEFSALYCANDFKKCLNDLVKARNWSDRPSKLKRLYEMLDDCEIVYEKGKPNEYYQELVMSHISQFPDSSEMEDKLLVNLFEKYQEYPSPENYMQTLVDRLSSSEDGWDHEPLRLRILKQFIKYGDYLRYETINENGKTVYGGFGGQTAIKSYVKKKIGKEPSEEEILKYLDDGIFDVLPTAKKEQVKPDRKYGLLKAADDLAGGKFRTHGGTKRYLYMFAMVYNMTYSLGDKTGDRGHNDASSSDIIDYSTDVEIKLFQDYYTNNLIRFAEDTYKNGRSGDYEDDPSGQGINYKNFAEMIYLYYIASDRSPQEKFQRSRKMIDEVEEEAFGHGKSVDTKISGTQVYRGFWHKEDNTNLFVEDILNLDEEKFKKFILEKYNCDTFRGCHINKKNGLSYIDRYGVQELETEQRTACEVYDELIGKLIREMAKMNGAPKNEKYDYTRLSAEKKKEEQEIWLQECNYGMWFAEGAALKDHEIRQNLSDKISCLLSEEKKASLTEKKLDDFITLLLSLDRFFDIMTESEKKREVTRTSMIVAFYYYYNAKWVNGFLQNKAGSREEKNFHRVFRAFAREADDYLVKAYYQPLNGKNIFDLLVVFSSYAYMNNFTIL